MTRQTPPPAKLEPGDVTIATHMRQVNGRWQIVGYRLDAIGCSFTPNDITAIFKALAATNDASGLTP